MRWFLIIVLSFSSLAIGLLITQPVSLQTHFAATMAIVALLAVFKSFDRRGLLRTIVMVLGAMVVLRYVIWRTVDTIPPVAEIGNFVPGIALSAAEMYCAAMLLLSLFVMAAPLNRPRKVLSANGPRPTVDIFITAFDEPVERIAATLAAVAQVDYPAHCLSIYLIDEGGSDELVESYDAASANAAQARQRRIRELASEFGAIHLTRRNTAGGKAGGLNNALAHSMGEFILIVDARHAPTRDCLRETIGQFYNRPQLALVQTPYIFIGPEPVERNLKTWNDMPSAIELFDGVLPKGLDRWGAVVFRDSVGVLRRSALDDVGGFSLATNAEGFETSLNLEARGWEAVFVDRPLAAAVHPTSIAAFLEQRTKWCSGMLHALAFNSPILRQGLSPAQRVCHLFLSAYWLFPIVRLVFLFAPLLYLFFGAKVYAVSGIELATYSIGFILTCIILQNYLWGYVRWPFTTELYQTIQSIYLLRAFSELFSRQDTQAEQVSGRRAERDSSPAIVTAPLYVLFFVLSGGVVITIYRLLAQPLSADITLWMGAWNVFNLLLVGAAIGAMTPSKGPTRPQRVAIRRPAELLYGDRVIPAKILDISDTSACVRAAANVLGQSLPGETITMRFQSAIGAPYGELDLIIGEVMDDGGTIVLDAMFQASDAEDFRQIADLVFADSDEWVRFQAQRRTGIGVTSGIAKFFWLALRQTGRGLQNVFGGEAFGNGRTPSARGSSQTTNTAGDDNAVDAPSVARFTPPLPRAVGPRLHASASGTPGTQANW